VHSALLRSWRGASEDVGYVAHRETKAARKVSTLWPRLAPRCRTHDRPAHLQDTRAACSAAKVIVRSATYGLESDWLAKFGNNLAVGPHKPRGVKR
jgi:hypothetical protein